MRNYTTHFTENAFWQKLSRAASSAGRQVVETALVLYYCLRDPDTPPKVRGIILGALGYLILPTDVIPDFVPGFGFADDFASLVTALTLLGAYVKPEHRARAKQRLQQWFPQVRNG